MTYRSRKETERRLRNSTKLGIESLESRLMNAAGGSTFPSLPSAGPPGPPALFSTVQNNAPTIKSSIFVEGGALVTGTSVRAAVLGADDGGENNLRYTWTVVTLPSNATVGFSTNANNAAKRTTLTFDRVGAYVIRVAVTDQAGLSASSTISLSVVPAVAQLQLLTPNGLPIQSNSTLQVTRANHRMQVRGLDQFGKVVGNLSRIDWTTLSAPPGGTVLTTVNAGVAAQSFSRAGNYRVRASIGSIQTEYNVSVVSTLAAVRIATNDGRVHADNARLNVGSVQQSFTLVSLDQFGHALATQPAAVWTTTTVPSGASLNLVTNGNNAVFTASRAAVYGIRATVGTLATNLSLNFVPTLGSLRFQTNSGTDIASTSVQTISGSSLALRLRGFDQFNNPIDRLPALRWLVVSGPSGGRITGSWSGGLATIGFDRAGSYIVNASIGTINTDLSVQVNQTLRSIAVTNAAGQALRPNDVLTVNTVNQVLNATGMDQFGFTMQSQPVFNWALVSAPTAGVPGFVTLSNTSRQIDFDRVGVYGVRIATAGLPDFATRILVTPLLSGLAVLPGTVTLNAGDTQQFIVEGRDQFNRFTTAPSGVAWSATGGTISASGLFTADAQAGNFSVSAVGGTFSGSAAVEILTGGTGPFTDPAIANLVAAYDVDSSISRLEMIDILRSAGLDGTVNGNELSDLRRLVSSTTYVMPEHVRALAKNVVHDNPANLRFQGQPAGNLAVGSSAGLLNSLIDKWFLGADLPEITNAVSGVTYQAATGRLFDSTPKLQDANQGSLGNSYFISALGAIAFRRPSAIQDMLIDNGDGTYTVRFFGGQLGNRIRNNVVTSGFVSGTGVPEYVTVNRMLPALSDGTLVYAQAGSTIADTMAVIWPALLEKAYAQWNETGKAGRNGTNAYSGIEGGWMSIVNAHVLGSNSTNHVLATSSPDLLIDALNAHRAVTIGTKANGTGDGLLPAHTYTITGYDRVTNTFTLHNPLGTNHPAPLTWTQLKANGTQFCVSDRPV